MAPWLGLDRIETEGQRQRLVFWDLERFWAWAELLQDPRDKERLRDVETGLVSAWKPEPWNLASETSCIRCSHDWQGVLSGYSDLLGRCVYRRVHRSDVFTDTWGICC